MVGEGPAVKAMRTAIALLVVLLAVLVGMTLLVRVV